MKRSRSVLKYWMTIGVVLLLVGCAENIEQQAASDKQSPAIQVNIPSDIAQQYGSFNIEYKTQDIQKSIHSDGKVSLIMQEQQLAELAQQCEQFFAQFADAANENGDSGIVAIEFDEQYANWAITVANTDFLNKESFMLAQEMLIKNILTYQLAKETTAKLKIQYLLADGTVMDEHILRTKFAYVR